MRIAYALLSPLLALAGCATTDAGPQALGAPGQSMQNCPMASSPSSGDQQQGGMMGDHAGQMMGQAQMMQGMHHGDMANCPMAQSAAPPAPASPSPTDPHQH